MSKTQRLTPLISLNDYSQHLLMWLGFMTLLLVSNNSFAATNAAGASCPAEHMMYYLNPGNAAITHPASLVTRQPLTWTANAVSNSFTYSNNNVIFKLAFNELQGLRPNHPRYVAGIEASTNSINNAIIMQHDSFNAAVNHKLTATINKPVSKFGFITQDIDSNPDWNYNETLSLAYTGGALTSINTEFLVPSNNGRTVTGIDTDSRNRPVQKNCNRTTPCDIDVDWGSNNTPNTRFATNTPFAVTHGNASNYPKNSPPYQTNIMGYSDFYFCMAPPKLTVVKQLDGIRVNNTNALRDQFEISVKNGNTSVNTFTTTGNDQNISNGNSGIIDITNGTTYTIGESVKNQSNTNNINQYDVSYSCTNTTTNSNTAMPSGTLNSAGTTRAFNLINPQYGDDITCTITNAPKDYTFTGFVFNDNGGIAENNSNNPNINTKSDISSTFAGNQIYFNGLFDSGESGISAAGLTVSLTNCAGTPIAGTTAQTVSTNPLGQFKFTVPANVIASLASQKVCLVQNEPSVWDFSVDTTTNTREVNLVAGTFDYKTESNGSRNLDFGEVKANYAALVLKKSQYVHSCINSLNYSDIAASTTSPSTGFSINSASNIDPGMCIAYKIEAFNRGHIDLQKVKITDVLQTTPIESVFNQPRPVGLPNTLYTITRSAPNYGQNGTIISDEFNLAKVAAGSSTATQATLLFNTKYGTTVNP